MAQRKSVDEKLDELDALPPDRADQSAPLTAALADKSSRVVAKAARLAAHSLLYDLVPALLAAYRRFLDKPAKTDPSCVAKKALARALVALDCDDVGFFAAGIRYRQLEPVWGGSADTAVDIRCSCAMGLVATSYSRALVVLTELLHDSEAEARIGAARAVACGNPREAELLLRSKVLAGDPEPAVIGECFSGLLAAEPDDALAFVAGYLQQPDEALRELAALAVGESRLEGALPLLRTAWEDVLISDAFRQALIRGAAAHRSEAGFDWLLSLAAEAREPVAEAVIGALAVHKHNAKLAERLERALAARGDDALQARFVKLWKALS